MTATAFLTLVGIFAALYIGVGAVLGFGASRFDVDEPRS